MTRLDADFFRGNRQRLAPSLEGGVLVLSAHDQMQAVADIAHPFRQESHFYYLSGLTAPRWRLVYDASRDYCWLVRPDYSDVERLFDGVLDDEAARNIAGADTVIDNAEFEALLRQLARKHSTAHTLAPESKNTHAFVMNPAITRLHAQLERCFGAIIDIRPTLNSLRARKQPQEIAMIRRAAAITADAFAAAKEQAATCKTEYELEAIFTSTFRRHNTHHAYDPIVAAGSRASILHYTANDQSFARQGIALCDIGASYNGYAADVTRMLVIGRTTKRQRAVYDALLTAQQAIIAAIEPGMSVIEYQKKVDEHMFAALRSLKLMNEWDEGIYRQYFPHAVSHGLGIDVHDSLGKTRTLEPTMVLTVEPGIYIRDEGIGMRIEDDILITDTGTENLTRAISTSLS